MKKLLALTAILTALAACSTLPSFGGGGNSLDAVEAATGGSTETLIAIVPPLVQAGSNFLEVLVVTALIASIFMRPVRLAVASLLVSFYGWIENFFKKTP